MIFVGGELIEISVGQMLTTLKYNMLEQLQMYRGFAEHCENK